MPDQNPTPAEIPVLTRDDVLLALDSAMATIATARMLVAKNWPADAALTMEPEEPSSCPTGHANRAPSYPAFCLDCDTDLSETDGGVSAQ